MAYIDMTVSVSKETYEMGEAVVELVEAVKKALEDGWQPLGDVPAIVAAVISRMGEIMQGAKEAKGEYEADPEASVMAAAMTLAALVKAVKQ